MAELAGDDDDFAALRENPAFRQTADDAQPGRPAVRRPYTPP
jgi:hypothetical protein